MTFPTIEWQPATATGFGLTASLADSGIVIDPAQSPAIASLGEVLAEQLYDTDGLLIVRGLTGIENWPQALVQLSQPFGLEVEDYRETLIAQNMVHPEVPQILVVSNVAPVNRAPPKRPEPALTQDGGLPTRFPHRRGWHTDQSYRRPPPDVSLFYAVLPAPKGEGQTLYANGVAAYEALPDTTKAKIADRQALHCRSSFGRTEWAARAGETPGPMAPHERPQLQPLVRRHPVTGREALFLCEAGQLDWFDGPIAGMEPGPDGEGARLVYELMRHYTDPRFVYVHEWEAGDLVIYDNRCTVHSATWFDAERHERVMWRTTVWGNPGPEYDNEPRSWRAA